MYELFKIIVGGPALALGTLLGSVAHLVIILLAIAAGIFLGRLIYEQIRFKAIAWPAAVFAGLWLTLVIHQSIPFMTAAMQREYYADGDD